MKTSPLFAALALLGPFAIPAASAADAGRPPAGADWPRMVAPPAPPEVAIIREDREKKEFVYETEHYEFLCDSELGANLVREFSRIFEATWFVNCVLPLDFRPKPEGDRKKFRARIFTNEADYFEAGGPPGSAGVYFPMLGELQLPLSSLGVKMFGSRVIIDYSSEDYRTLIHEITHQMMNRWIALLPIWYIEGSAEYVALARYENGRFSFLQQDRRLRDWLSRIAGPGKFLMTPLEKLMALTPASWLAAVAEERDSYRNYPSALVLTYYFYHLDGDGKGTHILDYVRAVGALKPGEDGSGLPEKYLLRGRDYTALQRDVQRALRRASVQVEFAE